MGGLKAFIVAGAMALAVSAARDLACHDPLKPMLPVVQLCTSAVQPVYAAF